MGSCSEELPDFKLPSIDRIKSLFSFDVGRDIPRLSGLGIEYLDRRVDDFEHGKGLEPTGSEGVVDLGEPIDLSRYRKGYEHAAPQELEIEEPLGDAPGIPKEYVKPLLTHQHEPHKEVIYRETLKIEELARGLDIPDTIISRDYHIAIRTDGTLNKDVLAERMRFLLSEGHVHYKDSITRERLKRLGFTREQISRAFRRVSQETECGVSRDASEGFTIADEADGGYEGDTPREAIWRKDYGSKEKDLIDLGDIIEDTGLTSYYAKKFYGEARVKDKLGRYRLDSSKVLDIYTDLIRSRRIRHEFSDDLLRMLGASEGLVDELRHVPVFDLGKPSEEVKILSDEELATILEDDEGATDINKPTDDGFPLIYDCGLPIDGEEYMNALREVILAEDEDYTAGDVGETELSLVPVVQIPEERRPSISLNEWDGLTEQLEREGPIPKRVYRATAIERDGGISFKDMIRLMGIEVAVSSLKGKAAAFFNKSETEHAYRFVLKLAEFESRNPSAFERLSRKTSEQMWCDMAEYFGYLGKEELIMHSGVRAEIDGYHLTRDQYGKMNDGFERVPESNDYRRMVIESRKRGDTLKGDELLERSQKALGFGEVNYRDLEFIAGTALGHEIYLGDSSDIPFEVAECVTDFLGLLGEDEADGKGTEKLYLWRLGRGVLELRGKVYERVENGHWIDGSRVTAIGVDRLALEYTYQKFARQGLLVNPEDVEYYLYDKKRSHGKDRRDHVYLNSPANE